MSGVKFSVFTKPWKTLSLEQLVQKVAAMGFDGVEYPLRDGFQVTPQEGEAGIIRLGKAFASAGLSVCSLAAGVDVHTSSDDSIQSANEQLFSGCAEAGIPIIRICQKMDRSLGFFKNIDNIKKQYDAILPLCEKYGVTLGVQMHYGNNVSSSAETYILLKDYDPKYIAAVWDSGHSGLSGVASEISIDTVYDMMCMVNFKAAYYYRANGPESVAKWKVHWTLGQHGTDNWECSVNYLKQRGYDRTVCLPAEYSDEENVDKYTALDLQYIRGLFSKN